MWIYLPTQADVAQHIPTHMIIPNFGKERASESDTPISISLLCCKCNCVSSGTRNKRTLPSTAQWFKSMCTEHQLQPKKECLPGKPTPENSENELHPSAHHLCWLEERNTRLINDIKKAEPTVTVFTKAVYQFNWEKRNKIKLLTNQHPPLIQDISLMFWEFLLHSCRESWNSFKGLLVNLNTFLTKPVTAEDLFNWGQWVQCARSSSDWIYTRLMLKCAKEI